MCDETDAPPQDEQSIKHAHLQVVFGLLGAKGAAIAHEVDEADGDAAVDVEDEVVFLGGGDGFDGDGVVEHFAAGESLLDEFFDKLNAEIGVVARFDFVADSRN